MNTSKILTACAIVMTASFSSFAGNPKGEAKTETPSKTEGKTKAYSNVYYVTSFDGTNYHLSTTPPPGPDPCPGGNDPCEITTKDVQGDLQITPAELNNLSQATIEETQDLF